MRLILPLLLLGCLVLSIGGCDRTASIASPTDTATALPDGKGVAFGLASTLKSEVLASCDSLSATATFGDGSTRTVRLTVQEAMAFSDKLFHLEALPADTSSRIEVVFYSKDGKTRYTVTLQISVKKETLADTTPKPVASSSSLVLLPIADAGIDEQGDNLGAEAGNRLAYRQGMILLDFGTFESLKGHRIVRARLHLQGWSNTADSNIALVAGTVNRGWAEGNGNWYYFDGKKANGYDLAYSNYPDRSVPSGTANPATAEGVRWSNSASLRASWSPACSSTVYLPAGGNGAYPRLANSAPIEFDVTAALTAMLSQGTAKALALRFASVSGSGLASTQICTYAREFGADFAPRLEVDLGDAAVAAGDSLELRPVQDAGVDLQDYNMGLGSELRLYEHGSTVLLDFGDLTSILSGKAVAKAELVLTGWQGLQSPDGTTGRTLEVPLDLGTVSRDWQEGFGNWYWFDGAGQNGYADAYSNWSSYVPPSWARNPASGNGATWTSTASIRANFRKYARVAPRLPEPAPYVYPTPCQAGTVRLDVTKEIRDMISSGTPLSLALVRPDTGLSFDRTPMFFSKDMAPEVCPRLVVTFAK